MSSSHPGRPSLQGEPPPKWAMRTYVLVLLYRGPNPEPDPEKAAELQRGHLANSARWYAEGKLLVAGPFRDDTDLRGIWIFDSDSVDEVKALCDTDPAIRAGTLRVEIHPWYSAKGLMVARPDVADPTP